MHALSVFLKLLPRIFEVIPLAVQVAEVLARLLRPGVKSGEFKLQAVKEVVRNAVLASELVSGRDIVDDALFDQGITEITNGAVKVLKAVEARAK